MMYMYEKLHKNKIDRHSVQDDSEQNRVQPGSQWSHDRNGGKRSVFVSVVTDW